jgi:S-adenosylmethionine/arginine decarboxylase-like enzyme
MWAEAEKALDYVIAQLTPDIVIITARVKNFAIM